MRLARLARVRLLRHALPVSLLILRKKNRLFCSLTYSSKREQSNERSGTRLKMESETGERRYGRVRLRACQTLTPLFTDFLTDFEKKPDCFAIYTVVIIRRCIAVQYLLKKSEM